MNWWFSWRGEGKQGKGWWSGERFTSPPELCCRLRAATAHQTRSCLHLLWSQLQLYLAEQGCRLQPPPDTAALQPPHLAPRRCWSSSCGKTPRFLFNGTLLAFGGASPVCVGSLHPQPSQPWGGRLLQKFFLFLMIFLKKGGGEKRKKIKTSPSMTRDSVGCVRFWISICSFWAGLLCHGLPFPLA